VVDAPFVLYELEWCIRVADGCGFACGLFVLASTLFPSLIRHELLVIAKYKNMADRPKVPVVRSPRQLTMPQASAEERYPLWPVA
jgi:hypothetical protein